MAELFLLELVNDNRKVHGIRGWQATYVAIKGAMMAHCIKIGEKSFRKFWNAYGLKVKIRHKPPITSISGPWLRRFPYLVRDFIPDGPDELWVSDITYLRLKDRRFAYLSLVMDAYSRKIVGYCLYRTLEAKGCVEALRMAIQQRRLRDKLLIHHSDGGFQYCSAAYLEILQSEKIKGSMTEKGPGDNAKAERLNRTLKHSLGLKRRFENFEEAEQAVARAIHFYNNIRSHSSVNYMTPAAAHQCTGPIPMRWKNWRKESKLKRMAAEQAVSLPGGSMRLGAFGGPVANCPALPPEPVPIDPTTMPNLHNDGD